MNQPSPATRSAPRRSWSLRVPLAAALVVLALSAGADALAAQTPRPGGPPRALPAAGAGEIRGTIRDGENKAPLASASVAVWVRGESTPVAGAITRADGSFRIQGLRPGTYQLRISMIGYGPQTVEEIVVTDAAPRVAAGEIGLARAAVALEGIDVTTERSAITVAPDRNAYRARDVAPAAATATDVLEQVPSVQVDPDGKVSLRGNDNVVVQINGRPSPIRGEQLAGYLRQMPAGTIDRVEVIPNPSARYDPEGMAGIINIVLKQNVDLGTSGGLTLGASSSNRYTASGNVGYQAGPITAMASYGYNWDERDITGINNRTRLAALRAPLSTTAQSLDGVNGNFGHNLNLSVDYRLGQRDVVSNALMVNRRTSTDQQLGAIRELDGGGAVVDRYNRLRDTGTENWMFDYTLAWKRTLEAQKHELSSEVRVNRAADEDRTTLWREALGLGAAGPRFEGENNELDAVTYQLTGQVDYTRTLAARTKLETGYRGNARWLDRDFRSRVDPLGGGTWLPGDMSNELEFDERVNAAYGVLSHGTGRVEMQAGLRAEHASRDFALGTTGESFPYDYTSLFPSALVSYKPGDKSEVKLSYSRRIRRPGTFELNPFPNFFDASAVFFGNPALNPEYTDAFELGLNRTGRMGSIQVSPFYRRTTDIIRFTINPIDTVAGREVTTVTFRNLDTGTSWGTDVNGSFRLSRAFNGFAGFNVFKMVTDGSSGATSLSSDAVTWSARLNGTLTVTPNTTLQGAYFYRAPMNVEGGRFSGASIANFSVRQKLQGDKLVGTLRVSDPFNTMRFRVESGDDRIVQLTERSFSTRAVHLSMQYTFGQAPRVRQRRPAEPVQEGPVGFPGQ